MATIGPIETDQLEQLRQEAEALRRSPDQIAYREARKRYLLAQGRMMLDASTQVRQERNRQATQGRVR